MRREGRGSDRFDDRLGGEGGFFYLLVYEGGLRSLADLDEDDGVRGEGGR